MRQGKTRYKTQSVYAAQTISCYNQALQPPSARAHSNPKPRKTGSDLELGGQPGYEDRSHEKFRRFLGDKRTKRAMLGYLQGWVETRSGVALGVTGRWRRRFRSATGHSFVGRKRPRETPGINNLVLLGNGLGGLWWRRNTGTNEAMGNGETVLESSKHYEGKDGRVGYERNVY